METFWRPLGWKQLHGLKPLFLEPEFSYMKCNKILHRASVQKERRTPRPPSDSLEQSCGACTGMGTAAGRAAGTRAHSDPPHVRTLSLAGLNPSEPADPHPRHPQFTPSAT